MDQTNNEALSIEIFLWCIFKHVEIKLAPKIEEEIEQTKTLNFSIQYFSWFNINVASLDREKYRERIE